MNDQATSILIGKFYKNLHQGNLSKAEALRQAQLSIIKNPAYRKHPYFWAAYILAGNWL